MLLILFTNSNIHAEHNLWSRWRRIAEKNDLKFEGILLIESTHDWNMVMGEASTWLASRFGGEIGRFLANKCSDVAVCTLIGLSDEEKAFFMQKF